MGSEMCIRDRCDVDSKPGGATSGQKQEDVDPTIGQNPTIHPIVRTGTLECVDLILIVLLLSRQASTRHVALPALN